MRRRIPAELTALVDRSVTELGRVIESELGLKAFRRIENLRRYVKSKSGQSVQGLLKMKKDLEKLNPQEQYQIAHAFALMLELINSCESAYRAHRLRQEQAPKASKNPGRIIHVLTAHPTESRSPDILHYFKKIQNLLEEYLQNPSKENIETLYILLKYAWRIPLSKQRKPSVMDEAEYIYSLVLQKEVIDVYLSKKEELQPFYIRTWVGGDKDGHPGVDDKAMLGSLQMSRKYLLAWADEILESLESDLEPLTQGKSQDKASLQKIYRQLNALQKSLKGLRVLKAGDSQKVASFTKDLTELKTSYEKIMRCPSLRLNKINHLLMVFPGLVVPLELREDSAVVQDAVAHPSKNINIVRMLKQLSKISPKHNPRFYVRGFILSQCESEKDIEAGVALVKRHLKEVNLPVVPLFESAHSLENSEEIISTFLRSTQNKSMVKKLWDNQLEIMLGYSDSSKESGSLASKVLIQSSILSLEKTLKKHSITPIFFHGSGGSIERGGGSVQDQTAWWPKSALKTVKVTIQGESIYRSYSAPEILSRQLQRFEAARDTGFGKASQKISKKDSEMLLNMSASTKASYQKTLAEPSFLQVIELATPYTFLKDLKLGSRPSKRQGSVEIKSLRAIPWILCWTQTRTLFPTWWGVGSFWQQLSDSEKNQYKSLYKRSSLFAAYIRLLSFTLAKMDLNVFSVYLQSSKLSKDLADRTDAQFRKEFALCRKAILQIAGEKEMLWYRPWMLESIHLRSPLIHPLNALQLIALKEKDVLLLRESVTGVASGMLTTG